MKNEHPVDMLGHLRCQLTGQNAEGECMTVIFLTPLLLSIVAAGYMVFASEAHLFWRVAVVVLVVTAAAMQVIDINYPGVYVHFLIPLFIQIIVSIGVLIASSLEHGDPFL